MAYMLISPTRTPSDAAEGVSYMSSFQASPRFIALGSAVVLPIIGTLLLLPARTGQPTVNAALLLMVPVVAVTTSGRRTDGILAAVSAAIYFDLCFTAPYGHLSFARREDLEVTVLLLITGLAVTEIASRAARYSRPAAEDVDYLAGISATTRMVAAAHCPEAVIEQVQVQVSALLALQHCTFERAADSDRSLTELPRLEASGLIRTGTTGWQPRRQRPDEIPAADIELVAACAGRTHGRFTLTPGPGATASRQARQVAVILASQVGASLASRGNPDAPPTAPD
jgi:K+-sensing histidine kinase KdpD